MEEIFTSFPLTNRASPEELSYRHASTRTKQMNWPPRTSRHPVKPKPFRRQVSRACDWCRAKRIKCDDQIPCRACLHRGAECTVEGSLKARTLPQAEKEIDHLRDKCKELEEELEEYRKGNRPGQGSLLTPISTPSTGDYALLCGRTGLIEGIFAANPRTLKQSYYGKPSMFYFVRQLGHFIAKTTGAPFTVSCFEGAHSRATHRKGCPGGPGGPSSQADASNSELCPQDGSSPLNPSMTRQQEEYFLGLFWENLHVLTPIVDEAEFRKEYDALWDGKGSRRKDSALVDIVIALCMQYGYSWLFEGSSGAGAVDTGVGEDPTIAGKWYYHRSRALVTSELEGPSLATVQTSIFASMYLTCASFSNMAHVTLAQAVRTAEIIGLHLEPPDSMSQAQSELRKRVWWCLFRLESSTCAKFGRKMCISLSEMTTSMPSDSTQVALLTDSSVGCYEDISYLVFNHHANTLAVIHRAIYDAIFTSSEPVAKADQGMAADIKDLERRAELLALKSRALNEWKDALPDVMRTARRGGGRAMSLDRQPLDIEPSAPQWLQRQRICLELNYHTSAYGLYRGFITFGAPSNLPKPTADRHATACINHAVAFTLIMNQVVTETDLMSGWHEYFLSQWNACLTIVGFIFSAPIHPSTGHARRALDKAIEVFEAFAVNFPFAASAASVARELKAKEEMIMSRLREGIVSGSTGMAAAAAAPPASASDVDNDGDVGVAGTEADAIHDDLSWLDPNQQDESLSVFVDWTMGVEAFGNFNRFNDQLYGGF